MEIDTESKELPLLTNEYGYNDINSISLIDRLKCVSYKDVYIKKRGLKRSIICTEERVKIIQDNAYIVPKQFVYSKKDKNYISGDYISVLLLDSMKKIREENTNLKNMIIKLQNRLNKIERVL